MIARRSALRGAAVILVALALNACYTYSPVETAPIGTRVRVHVPVQTAIGGTQTETIEGSLLENGDPIVLAIRNRREIGAYREVVQYDTLTLSSSQTTRLEIRELNTPKTVGLTAGIIAAAVISAIASFEGGSQGDDPSPPDQGPITAVVSSSMISSVIGWILR